MYDDVGHRLHHSFSFTPLTAFLSPSLPLSPLSSIPFFSCRQLSGKVIVLQKSSQPITSYFSSDCSDGAVSSLSTSVCYTAEGLASIISARAVPFVYVSMWETERVCVCVEGALTTMA